MAYKTLYRKYRPTNFDEVVGQKYIIETIKNSIINDRICHAYLFSGPRGIGKTSIARIIAKAVNCKHLENGNPCNHCELCESINDQSAIDVTEIDAASNNGVDEIRLLLEKVNFLPVVAKYKIYIIDEVHMLSLSAFNALLKTLEEPPMHVIFILATTEVHKIPSTILSRCQRFDFKPLTNDEIKEQLKKISLQENIAITDDALSLISEASSGGMRDALSILDQASAFKSDLIEKEDVENITGRVSNDDLLTLIKLIHEERISDALDQATLILNKGKETNVLVQMLLSTYRDMLLYNTGSKVNKYIYNNQMFVELAKQIKKSQIFKYVDILNSLQNQIRVSGTIALEVSLVKMMTKEQGQQSYISQDVDLTDVYNRLSILENKPKEENNDSLREFKDYTKGKLEFLENIVSKITTQPQDLVERIEALEEQTPISEIEKRLAKLETPKDINTSFDDGALLALEERTNNAIKELEERLKQNNSKDINQDQLNDLSAKLNSLKQKIDSLNNLYVTHEELNNKLEFGDDLFSQSEPSNLSDIYRRLSTLEQGMDNKLEPLPFEEDENEALIASVNMNQAEINDLKEKLNDLNSLVSELKNSNSLEERFNLLQDSLMEMQNEIALVKESLNKDSDEALKNEIVEIKEYAIKVATRVKALEEKEERVEKENPSVLTKRPQPFETRPREAQLNQVETEEVKETKEIEDVKDNTRDDTAKVYDVKIIENILHQSRDKKNSDDSNKIKSVWPRLASLVPENLQVIAETLSEGRIVVNGANYLLIVYEKASICNYLMTTNNHNDARHVLRNTLQKDYDFIALPINTWQDIRTEYKNQYHMGIKYPTLSPINNPELKVINLAPNTFKTQKTQNYEEAVKLFGESIIKEVK